MDTMVRGIIFVRVTSLMDTGQEVSHSCMILHTFQSPQEEGRRTGWAPVPVGTGGWVAESHRGCWSGSSQHSLPQLWGVQGADILSSYVTTYLVSMR